jgi:hypothetical protein
MEKNMEANMEASLLRLWALGPVSQHFICRFLQNFLQDFGAGFENDSLNDPK